DVRGTWQSTLLLPDRSVEARWEISGSAGSPRGTLKIAGGSDEPAADASEDGEPQPKEKQIRLSQLGFQDGRLNATFTSDSLELAGVAQLSVVLSIPKEGPATWLGSITWPDGQQRSSSATRRDESPPADKSPEADEDSGGETTDEN